MQIKLRVVGIAKRPEHGTTIAVMDDNDVQAWLPVDQLEGLPKTFSGSSKRYSIEVPDELAKTVGWA